MAEYTFKNRPPIGIMPQYIWVEKRAEELQQCILRYSAAGLELNPECITELMEHLRYLKSKNIEVNTHGSTILKGIRNGAILTVKEPE